MPTAD
jgi:hypothetical protein